MTSMNISVPESMRTFVEEQVQTGGYGTISEYLRELIRDAQKRKAEDRVAHLVLEAMDSPSAELTDQDWVDMRQAVQERLAKRKQ